MPRFLARLQRSARASVSVPRRALRGHAPTGLYLPARIGLLSFSAPKGVERACPATARPRPAALSDRFSAPKGVERACPDAALLTVAKQREVSVPRRALRGHAPRGQATLTYAEDGFSAPKGVERACPIQVFLEEKPEYTFQCPEGR